MSGEILVRLTVNRRPVAIGVKPGTTLLRALRHHLHLTGTKEGCGSGDCGACTVIVDGRPVNACLALAVDLDGAEITTIEGLQTDGELHALQKSFVKHAALQCGFCTPGMIMQAIDLVEQNDNLDNAAIREGLEGNLCRCTGYHNIVRAIQSVADAG